MALSGGGGIPLEGATVTLREAGLVATTDSEGLFSFDVEASQQNILRVLSSKPKSGDLITFSKEGYDTVSRRVKSNGGKENVVLADPPHIW